MPTGSHKSWDFESETQRFTPCQNKSGSFENMVLSYFQRLRTDCIIESNFTTGRQKKTDCFTVDGFCNQCNTAFEAMVFIYHYCSCQEGRPSLSDADIKRGVKKREQNGMRRDYTRQKIPNFTPLLLFYLKLGLVCV